ncbi:hypothetical protein [Haloechinothrix salitolerans]|uniref:Uncharacterized protein n=1 Tax=Haloechinothrix salitolerans TaxID=926830 RepID=A0ABW2C4J8_9PSEU
MSELAVAGDLAEGRLVAITVTDLDLRRAFRAVWPGGRKLIGPAAALLTVAARG